MLLIGNRLVTRAETKNVDFDGILADLADKVENAPITAAILHAG